MRKAHSVQVVDVPLNFFSCRKRGAVQGWPRGARNLLHLGPDCLFLLSWQAVWEVQGTVAFLQLRQCVSDRRIRIERRFRVCNSTSMSFTFAGKVGSRMRERIKSSTSFIPCPSGMATTSYLSKAARIAGMAGSGVDPEAVGFLGGAWLAAGSTTIRNNTTQPKRGTRQLSQLSDCASETVLPSIRSSMDSSCPNCRTRSDFRSRRYATTKGRLCRTLEAFSNRRMSLKERKRQEL